MQTLQLCSWVYWIRALHLLKENACMGGCLGGYVRPPPAAALPEQANTPFKRRSNRRLRGQSASTSRDWWMSSSNDIQFDNRSVLNSPALRNVSGAVNDSQNSGSASHDNETFSFQNHALANWHQQRQEWVGRHKPQPRQLREPVLRWSATYKELLGTSRPFAEPVPLPEMVTFLVDVWEQEGLGG